MNEPRVLRLHRVRGREVEKAMEGRKAQEHDFERLIAQPTIVVDEDVGAVTVVYLAPLDEDTEGLVAALRRVRMEVGERTGGLRGPRRIVGYQPRRGGRFDDTCNDAKLAREDREAHALVCSFAPVVASYYQRYGPDVYARHQEEAGRVLPEWTLEGTPFTSGHINRDSPLAYHFDAGNFKGVWSNMLGFKQGVSGGYLSVPAYDVGFEIADRSLLMFDGQGLLHGVTPLVVAPGGHRFTIVYYSAASMWECLPHHRELARIQRLRSQRE